ncbi:MAG: response regulator [Bryobacteraceae bacterium]
MLQSHSLEGEVERRNLQVLLVEDNEADVRLLREGFKHIKTPVDLTVAHDGEAALEFLGCKGKHAAAQLPDLILLDLNLPGQSGADVLQQVKTHPELRLIPVIVLTSSSARNDVVSAYRRGANSYLRKPTTLDGLYKLVDSLEQCWFNLALIPSRV